MPADHARRAQIKSTTRSCCSRRPAAWLDGVYQDIFEALKPGVRENEIVALAQQAASTQMEIRSGRAINAVLGRAVQSTSHFTDRIIRPGDQAFFDIIHSYNGYRTCIHRTLSVGSSTAPQQDAYAQAREVLDAMATDLVRPGVGTDGDRQVVARGHGVRFANEMAASGLQFGHGLGLGLHERPV